MAFPECCYCFFKYPAGTSKAVGGRPSALIALTSIVLEKIGPPFGDVFSSTFFWAIRPASPPRSPLTPPERSRPGSAGACAFSAEAPLPRPPRTSTRSTSGSGIP